MKFRGRISHALEELRGSLWFVPGLMAMCAVLLALVTLRVDDWASWGAEEGWLYTRSAAGARDLLSTVASSMITVAGVAFSILVVALQLASSQFGPRVLRNFMRDRGSQFVLGTFIGTFLYCLMIMRTIDDGAADEPRLAVTLAVVLAVVSLGVLIYFLHHSAASIQAPNVIAGVTDELRRAIERTYPERGGAPAADEAPPDEDGADDQQVTASRTGYIQRIDIEALVSIAAQTDTVVRVLRRPGDFITRGTPLCAVSTFGSEPNRVGAALERAFIVGRHRTAEQDVEFSVEQLLQIALRALSPAYNDPFTAVACIQQLRGTLENLVERREPPAVHRDAAGCARVVARPVPVSEIVGSALGPIIEATSAPLVSQEIAVMLETLAPRAATDDVRMALAAQVMRLGQRAEALQGQPGDDVRRRCGRALQALRMITADAQDTRQYEAGPPRPHS